MARIKLSGTQIPTLSKLNIDGELTLDAAAGTTGQVLISQGAGNSPSWTSSLSAITNLSSAASTSLTIASAGATSANTGNLSIQTGTATTSGSSGYIYLDTGGITIGAGNANGIITIGSTPFALGNGNVKNLYLGNYNSTTNVYGTVVTDVINASSATATTPDLFGNITTGTIGVGDSMTTGTLNLATGSVTNTSGRTVNINTNASGSMTVTTNIGSNVLGGQINLITGTSGGVTITGGGLTLPAGTSGLSVSPLKFTANTSTPPLSAGGIDYDGSVFYGTPKVNNTTAGKGIIPTQMYFSPFSTVTAISTSTAGSNTGNAFGKSIYLAASTAYEIEGFVVMQTSYTVTAPSGLGISYTAPSGTTSGIYGTNNGTTVAATTSTSTTAAMNLNSTASNVTASFGSSGLYNRVYFKGILKTSTTAGNFNINYSITSAAAPATTQVVTQPGSFISVTPISGAAGSDINVGGWA
jgi:hypothetical protein